ncbi:venom serine carboxypeptidase-like [Zerene cesonia]|uniref:venom serine carboxypeptidase-like n=1 Tax=Zerene cesonia TaxID=33412 RepID=UPI0018E54A9C|nr:venom serine carboxypeptidase-like [Zerene cesonia]
MITNIMILLVTCVTVLYQISAVKGSLFPFVYPRINLEAKFNEISGDPLILTPYLEKREISLARNLSRVSFTEKIGFPSYAGFFTVDKKYDSNLYFWYFPAFNKNKAAPVVLWLQGGPGGSSLFGLFTENGPLIAKKNGFAVRKYHWAIENNLIFIDNPVGTGFSFTKDKNGYCKDETCIAKGLHSCLQQFFTLFPNLRNNNFYITGESYAGKYIPSLGLYIHDQNMISKDKINLKGMALGNAYCDPVNQLDYGNYLYQHGLIDFNQQKLFLKMQTEITNELKQQNWIEAGILMDKLMDGDLTNFSYFKNYTGFSNYYNFLEDKDTTDTSVFIKLLNNDKIRNSVHVGGLPFNDGREVQINLSADILQSVAPYVSQLLSHYRLMFYNGQLDIIVAYPLTENFLRNLKFSASDEYKVAPRKIWRVGDNIAGYYKKAGNLTEVLVRNAGHMVPHDQPKWAFDLIHRFILNKL